MRALRSVGSAEGMIAPAFAATAVSPRRRGPRTGLPPSRERMGDRAVCPPLPRVAETGFTLVEVLIALMIFGLIAAAGVAILTFSVRAQTATGKRFDDLSALNRTTALLAGDLGQAIDRPARDEGGNRLPAFTGEANGQMRFVRTGWTNVDAAPRASVQKVAYALDGDTLQRIAYPMVDGAPPLPPVTLLGKVAGIAARYRYKGAWSDRWDGTQGAALPQAAEIVLRRTDGTALRLMLLVGSGYAPPPLGVPQPAPTATGTPGAT